MIAYRIPTQGRNFLDVMEVVQFLPAAFGDAIIMPTEAIIKAGSDFDYDKMFTFYPNLNVDGTYEKVEYTKQDLKRLDADAFRCTLQNELYDVMADLILHPSNYMELVTPSSNYHVMPLVEKIFKKVHPSKVRDGKRIPSDYKNTDVLNRARNIEKFTSLLNSKSDLGIAAVANTFNVLFQLSNATGNAQFFSSKKIKTFFESSDVSKNETNNITNVFYGDIYDEDGVHKSEFLAEFINSFVDAAKDDYVFAINFVTEITPMAFYMKYSGLSSRKIFAFVNQPAIRTYVKNLSKYESMFVNNYLEKSATDVERMMMKYGPDEIVDNEDYKALQEKLYKLKSSARAKALSETVKQLGFDLKGDMRSAIDKELLASKMNFDDKFTSQNLYNNIVSDETLDVSKLSSDKKYLQLAVLFEMLNQKIQSDSITEAQRFLNFDTKPYSSTFDAYTRTINYANAVNKKSNVLSPETLKSIKKQSIISPLDAAPVIVNVLDQLFPLRNSKKLNVIILQDVLEQKFDKKNLNIVSDDDMNRYARTFKNDLMNYILQNYFSKSKEGVKFFNEMFNTDKSLNEYLKELIETPVMREQFTKIKQLPFYSDLVEQFPLIENIIVEPGENTRNFVNFKLLQNTNNSIEKSAVISQFDDLVSLEDVDLQIVRDFFRNLALYSIFQSGYNTGQNSFTGTTPVGLVNKLYEYSQKEFLKLSDEDKSIEYGQFSFSFKAHNPAFFAGRSQSSTPTVKTLTSRNFIIKNGIYQTENAEGNTIPVELKLYKSITVNDLNTQDKKEYYAKNEGFASWIDLMEKVMYGQTRTLRPEFLEGNQKVNVYRIKYLGESKEQNTEKESVTESGQVVKSDMSNEAKIVSFRESLPYVIEMTNEQLEGMYNSEKLSGETIEEFLQRMSCLGKLK